MTVKRKNLGKIVTHVVGPSKGQRGQGFGEMLNNGFNVGKNFLKTDLGQTVTALGFDFLKKKMAGNGRGRGGVLGVQGSGLRLQGSGHKKTKKKTTKKR